MWNNITDEDIEKADGEFGVGGEPPGAMGAMGAVEAPPPQQPQPPQVEEEAKPSPALPPTKLTGDSSIQDEKETWLSTEEGDHFKVGEGGEIKAGFGGKFNGEKLSALSPKNYSEAATGTTVTAHVKTKAKGEFDLKYQKQKMASGSPCRKVVSGAMRN
jgi:hypothetical protein